MALTKQQFPQELYWLYVLELLKDNVALLQLVFLLENRFYLNEVVVSLCWLNVAGCFLFIEVEHARECLLVPTIPFTNRTNIKFLRTCNPLDVFLSNATPKHQHFFIILAAEKKW